MYCNYPGIMKLDRWLKTCLYVCEWQYKEGKKLKPKPNYNSVDLAEVEWEDTDEKVSNTHSRTLLCLLMCVVQDP